MLRHLLDTLIPSRARALARVRARLAAYCVPAAPSPALRRAVVRLAAAIDAI